MVVLVLAAGIAAGVPAAARTMFGGVPATGGASGRHAGDAVSTECGVQDERVAETRHGASAAHRVGGCDHR